MVKRSKKLAIDLVNSRQRRKALKNFGDLINREVEEKVWQSFFDENPFILTESLSLKLDGLYRKVPLLSGIPDYIFYRNTGNKVTGDFGVIELKRPDQSIVGVYSSKIITPSRTLRVAQQEVTQHLDAIQRGQFLNTDDFFLAGNRRYAFIIIGVTSEITHKCHEEIFRHQFQNLLPPGLQLYTYDELFRLFSSSVPPTIHVLFAAPVEESDLEITREFTITWKYGLHARPTALFVQTTNQFRSEIKVTKGNQKANGKSIMALLMLAVDHGSRITVTARGKDAKAAIDAIGELIRSDFHMETRYGLIL